MSAEIWLSEVYVAKISNFFSFVFIIGGHP